MKAPLFSRSDPFSLKRMWNRIACYGNQFLLISEINLRLRFQGPSVSSAWNELIGLQAFHLVRLHNQHWEQKRKPQQVCCQSQPGKGISSNGLFMILANRGKLYLNLIFKKCQKMFVKKLKLRVWVSSISYSPRRSSRSKNLWFLIPLVKTLKRDLK